MHIRSFIDQLELHRRRRHQHCRHQAQVQDELPHFVSQDRPEVRFSYGSLLKCCLHAG